MREERIHRFEDAGRFQMFDKSAAMPRHSVTTLDEFLDDGDGDGNGHDEHNLGATCCGADDPLHAPASVTCALHNM